MNAHQLHPQDASSVQLRREVPLDAGVVSVDDLGSLSPLQIRDARLIVYGSKGASSHAEVICRIKGIPMVRREGFDTDATSMLYGVTVPMSALQAFAQHRGGFQVVVTSAEDLEGLDLSEVRSVFVRFEHLLYWNPQVWGRASGFRMDAAETLGAALRDLRAAVPPNVQVLVRGLDVRSNDAGISHWFHPAVESNPELGRHGLRWLLTEPEWMRLELDVIRNAGDVVYAVPFVSNVPEHREFCARYGHLIERIVPFIESPAALRAIGSLATSGNPGSIGLKDVAQFYFAVDRTNPTVAGLIDYLDEGFLDFVSSSLRSTIEVDTGIAVYQNLAMFEAYASRLGPTGWMPSVAASEFRSLVEAAHQTGEQ